MGDCFKQKVDELHVQYIPSKPNKCHVIAHEIKNAPFIFNILFCKTYDGLPLE